MPNCRRVVSSVKVDSAIVALQSASDRTRPDDDEAVFPKNFEEYRFHPPERNTGQFSAGPICLCVLVFTIPTVSSVGDQVE